MSSETKLAVDPVVSNIMHFEGLRKSRHYKVLLPCTFVAFWCLGSIFSVSILTKPIKDLVPSWDSEVVPRSLSVQGAFAGIVPIFVGRDLERRGHDFYATVGVIIQALGGLAASFSLFLQIEWYYYLASIMQGIGYGCLYTSLVHFILVWYQDMPGATAGVIGGALGFGSMSFTGIYYRAGKNIGPHWTFVILPIIVACIALPITMLLKTPPPDFVKNLAGAASKNNIAGRVSSSNVTQSDSTTSKFERNGELPRSTEASASSDGLRRLEQGDVDLNLEDARRHSPELEDPVLHVIELPEDDDPPSVLDTQEVVDSDLVDNTVESVGEMNEEITDLEDGEGLPQKQSWKQRMKSKLAQLRGKSKIGYAKLKGDSGSGGMIDMDRVIEDSAKSMELTDLSKLKHNASNTQLSPNGKAAATSSEQTELIVYEGLSRSELTSRRELWLMEVIIVCSLTSGWGLLSCYSVMLTSLFGFSEASAASSIVTITFLYGIGRFVWGFISDKIGFLSSYSIFLIGQSICYTLAPFCAPKYPALFVFILCINASLYGGAKVVIVPLANHIFHRENAATATGLAMAAIAISSALGPNIAALCVEAGKRAASEVVSPQDKVGAMHTGFSGFFFFGAILTAVGSFACLILKPLPEKARRTKAVQNV